MPLWENPLIFQSRKDEGINVILISLDTLRPDHLGSYGYKRNTSPNIDSMVEDSTIFTNTYSTSSWTLPAHISLLTGLNNFHHGIYFPSQRMNPKEITIANILKNHQYYTAAITGGGYLSPKYGFANGFDNYYAMRIGKAVDLRLNEVEHLARLSCQWLKENKNKSFFLFLHTYQPHDPYANPSKAGQSFLQPQSRWKQIRMESVLDDNNRFAVLSPEESQNVVDLYDGEIKYTDDSYIRPIIQTLKELNLYDNTMIIITSDHGEEFYEHNGWLHDHSLYDEGIRIPLIIKFPKSKFKGSRVEFITRITDIGPTILDQLKVNTTLKEMDGKSLLPMIKGEETADRTFVAELAFRDDQKSYPDLIASNYQQYKLIWNRDIQSPYIKKKSLSYKGKQIELYNIKKDPQEKKNLALHSVLSKTANEILKRLNHYLNQIDTPGLFKNRVKTDENLRQQLKTLGYLD